MNVGQFDVAADGCRSVHSISKRVLHVGPPSSAATSRATAACRTDDPPSRAYQADTFDHVAVSAWLEERSVMARIEGEQGWTPTDREPVMRAALIARGSWPSF
jgi:hypothetical protein